MTRLRRRPRALYRVYGEEEYLAGVDTLPARANPPLAGEPTHGRRLQRIAGAAALTGAVGTVGGVVGLAGLRPHTLDRREIAQRVAPSTPGAALRRHASASAHVARDQSQRRSPSRRTHERGGVSAQSSLRTASPVRTSVRGLTARAPRIVRAHETDLGSGASTGASNAAGRAAGRAPAEAPSAAQAQPASEARPQAQSAQAQSEFGFER